MRNHLEFALPVPSIGQDIYVPTKGYLSHGEDDVAGGRAKISRVEPGISGGEPAVFVSVHEHPGHSYNWKFLSEQQTELEDRFGNKRAHPDPDRNPDFNDW